MTGSASITIVRKLLFVGILLLVAGTVALAQAGRGGINGLVTDPSGAIVPGAKVTLLNHATRVTQHTVTASTGLYNLVALNPGVYAVDSLPADRCPRD